MPSRNSTPRPTVQDSSKWNGATVQIGHQNVHFRKDSTFLNTDILPEEPLPQKGQDLSINFQSKKVLESRERFLLLLFPKEIRDI